MNKQPTFPPPGYKPIPIYTVENLGQFADHLDKLALLELEKARIFKGGSFAAQRGQARALAFREIAQMLRQTQITAPKSEPATIDYLAILQAARDEITWWVEEHGCCAGHEAETLERIDAVIKPKVVRDKATPDLFPCHVFYTDQDPIKPERILDRNGQVVLSLCKVCGQAEGELTPNCHGYTPILCSKCPPTNSFGDPPRCETCPRRMSAG